MEDLEVGHLRGIAGLGEGLESALDELGLSTAEDCLLSEEVGVGLVVEGGLEDTCAGGSKSLCKSECDLLCVSGDILVDADESGDSESLSEHDPLHVSGGLGCHHDDIDVCRGDDELVGDCESVCELEGCTLFEVGLDVLLVDVGLDLVGQEHHDDVCVFDCISELCDFESVLLGLVPGFSVLPCSDGDIHSRVVEAECLCPSLGSVSEDGDFLSVEDLQVCVIVMVKLHGLHLWGDERYIVLIMSRACVLSCWECFFVQWM